ncbi:hypothetical protein F5X68DRAFT_203121 [Plectosphaerella plurivora]|uniref:Secreted protein n=1 Tax=Plectosphaerella plurivora TaxID=936078 RepID=A0A9P8VG34_9PEZI|nr:hypothetical protein F5X68DRAFT_203121 [Plectosphaerella plurivora]
MFCLLAALGLVISAPWSPMARLLVVQATLATPPWADACPEPHLAATLHPGMVLIENQRSPGGGVSIFSTVSGFILQVFSESAARSIS